MSTTLEPGVTPDAVMTFAINPGTLRQFLETRPEGGPRLKCVEGSVTLVSPGRSHETKASRLDRLVLLVCLELGIRHAALRSTTWTLPPGAGDTAYEADAAYYFHDWDADGPCRPPDLAIEVVVSHPEAKALRAGALLGIPELWVLDVPGHRLTFHRLATRGPRKGTYLPRPRSVALPVLTAAEVLERLDDPESDDTAYFQNCRDWARRVLLPRRRGRQ